MQAIAAWRSFRQEGMASVPSHLFFVAYAPHETKSRTGRSPSLPDKMRYEKAGDHKFAQPPQFEYGPKGQGCSKPRENRLYVAGPMYTCPFSGVLILLSILLCRSPRLDAQPLKINNTAIPRETNDKLKRSRILFRKTFRLKRLRPW